MRFLKRKVRAVEPDGKVEPPKVVYREIEITVQREWTSVTVGNPAEDRGQPTAGEVQEPAQPVPSLPAVTKPE